MINADGKRKLHRDNRGAALAMVIVIIAFIAILAAVLMFLAYAGFRMRLVDRQGKDTFYTAETVLDEINVGLQGEISESLAKAYEEVMTNYALYRDSLERNAKFREIYFAELQERLQKDDIHTGNYNITRLRSYLSHESLGDGTDGSRSNFGTYGAIVESDIGANDDDAASFIMELTNSRLLLKDLRVSYVSETGYVSIISTDIRIDLPSFTFSQAAALPSLDTCSLIADDTLFMGSATNGGSITIKGDAYAGQMIVGGPEGTVSSALEEGNPVTGATVEPTVNNLLAAGVSFENLVGVDAANLSLVVSRGDIEVGAGSALETTDAELWAQNLTLTSASVDLDGSINLKDDLTLEGTRSEARLSGEYNGFGYLVSSVGTGGSTGDEEVGSAYSSPDASSAIVINGRESTLDLSGLERMTISGRAYVATAYSAKTNPDATEEEKGNKANVMMGESVAVKSNQLIYLVPGEALGCRREGATIGESEYGSNPLTLEQYQEIYYNPDKYVLLDGDRQIAALGNKRLSNYINQELVAAEDGEEMAYVPEIIFRQTNAGPLVYCYLRFKDEDAANDYFRDYYSLNTEFVDRYTRLYASDIKMSDDPLYLNITGNMLVYEGEEPATLISSNDYNGNRPQAQRISTLKSDMFNSLSVKMVSTSNQLTDAELSRTAFSNIIDELEVKNVLDAQIYDKTEAVIETTDGTGSMVLTEKSEYIVGDGTPANAKIIVSLGNVTVTKNFTGLIVAKGNITIAASGQLTLEPIDVNSFSNILQTKVTELSPPTEGYTNDYYLMNVFVDGLSYAFSGNVAYDEGTSRVSMVDLINYERWTKK